MHPHLHPELNWPISGNTSGKAVTLAILTWGMAGPAQGSLWLCSQRRPHWLGNRTHFTPNLQESTSVRNNHLLKKQQLMSMWSEILWQFKEMLYGGLFVKTSSQLLWWRGRKDYFVVFKQCEFREWAAVAWGCVGEGKSEKAMHTTS